MKFLISPIVLAVLTSPGMLLAQREVTLISPGSLEPEMGKLIPKIESKMGVKVNLAIASGGVNKQKVISGTPFDVVILQPPYPDVLASGNIVAASAIPIASVTLGLAVRKGAPKPDISTSEAVKRTLLAAKSIAYPEEAGAASAAAFKRMIEKLGIADQLQPKLKPVPNVGGAMELVAKGEADMGLTFMSGMDQPGIDVVGAFPKDSSPPTLFVAFVGTHAKDAAVAKSIVDYLASPEALAVYKLRRMEAGR